MDRIHLDFECDEPWDRMKPDRGGRRCTRCDEVVVDLTQMPKKRALEVLARGGGCVSFLELPNGRALFRPQPHRAGALAGIAAGLLAACGEPEAGEPVAVAPVAQTLAPPSIASPIAPRPSIAPTEPADCADDAPAEALEVAALDEAGSPPETPPQPIRRRGRRHRSTSAASPVVVPVRIPSSAR